MQEAPLVSIIIINYNTYATTVQCVESVIAHTRDLSFEIILIENGTGQFHSDNVQSFGDHVGLLVSDTNLGFAGANNLGIRHASGTYILLLNSDIILKENSIKKTLDFLMTQPKAGVVSPRLVYPDGRVQSIAQRFPSPWYNLVELFRLQKLYSRKKAGRLLLGAFFDGKDTVEADWVWGAFFMIPAAVIRQLPGGQLDPAYFMYWEDVQWCLDVKKLGYKVFYFAGTEAIHLHEGSKGAKNELMEQNGKLFLNRNYSFARRSLLKFTARLLDK